MNLISTGSIFIYIVLAAIALFVILVFIGLVLELISEYKQENIKLEILKKGIKEDEDVDNK